MRDACGVCGGEGACLGCDGVPYSGKRLDRCGVCGGDAAACAPVNRNAEVVSVVWGLQPGPGPPPAPAGLDLAAPRAQSALAAACARLSADGEARGFVQPQGTVCWIVAFRAWLEAQGRAFPVPRATFLPLVARWYYFAAALRYRDKLGFDNSSAPARLTFVRVDFLTTLARPAPAAEARAHYDFWEAAVGALEATPELGAAFQSCEAWNAMFAEVRLWARGFRVPGLWWSRFVL